MSREQEMICLVSCIYTIAKRNYLEEMRYTSSEFKEILGYSGKEVCIALIDHEVTHQQVQFERMKTLFENRGKNSLFLEIQESCTVQATMENTEEELGKWNSVLQM